MAQDGTLSIRVNGEHRRVRGGHQRRRSRARARARADQGRGRAQPRDRAALDAGRGRRSRMATISRSSPSWAAAETWPTPGQVAGRTFTSRLIVGTGKYKSFEQNAAAVEASGAEIVTVAVRRVNISDPRPADADRLYRPEEDHLSAQHRRLLHRRGGDPHAAAGARGGRLGPGQARGAGRGEDALSRHARDAAGDRDPGRGGLQADGLLRRRSDRREAARGGRRGRDHAARRADRLGPRHPEPGDDPADRRGRERAGAGRCRRRHRLRRRGGDGAGLRRRADEHRHRRGEGPGDDGAGDEARGRDRAASPISPAAWASAATPTLPARSPD